MNKVNYNKGKRRELILLLHYCGVIPYSSVNFLEKSKKSRMYHHLIDKLRRDESIIAIGKHNGERLMYFIEYDNNLPLYTNSIPSEYIDYYRNVSYDNSKKARADKKKADKIIRTNELIMMMYSVGIKTLLNDKDNIIRTQMLDSTTPTFYQSREVKKGANYTELVTTENGNQTVSASRMDGLIISKGGIYPVYNLRRSNYNWKPQGELRMKMYVEILINTKHADYEEEHNYICKDVILIAKSNTVFQKMLAENNKNNTFKELLTIQDIYENIYSLTSDENGQKMLQIMTQEKWKQNILKDTLPAEEIMENKFTTVACDGWDKENNIYKVVFCIPNLTKLYKFSMRAKLVNDKSRFIVYCFDYQTPLVTSITEGYATIKQIPLDTYYYDVFPKCTNEESED